VGNASASASGDDDDHGGDNNLYQLGMNAIRENKVAAVLLAGGQGTRLGFDGPKGMYDIGLTSGRTLFCLIAQRILKLTQLAKKEDADADANADASSSSTDLDSVRIPLHIMASPMNHDATKAHFESNEYFGLGSDHVIFFPPRGPAMPVSRGEHLVGDAVQMCNGTGWKRKILMETPYKCAMAPDGNGGIYPAMEQCGVLEDMATKGIEHIHTFSIDNALVMPADPFFFGYCIKLKADCGNKVLWKTDPHEKVGVIAEKDDMPCVVEYSELSTDMAERRVGDGGGGGGEDDDSKLAFGAANICNHYYNLDFFTK